MSDFITYDQEYAGLILGFSWMQSAQVFLQTSANLVWRPALAEETFCLGDLHKVRFYDMVRRDAAYMKTTTADTEMFE